MNIEQAEFNKSITSRVFIRSATNTSEHTLPLHILPSASCLATIYQNQETQTTLEGSSHLTPSKSCPSFAETQLLAVYYPDRNASTTSTTDHCLFVEQQDRQPRRFRASYDHHSSTKSTQTPLTLTENDSFITIDTDCSMSSADEQQLLSAFKTQSILTNRARTNSQSSSSSSSVTTVIAQDVRPVTTRVNTNAVTRAEQSHQLQSSERVSSWPPVPDEIIVNDHSLPPTIANSHRSSSYIQSVEQSVPVMTVPASSHTIGQSRSLSTNPTIEHVDSHLVREQLQLLDYYPADRRPTNSNRIGLLRSVFEQSSMDPSTLTSPMHSTVKQETDEKLSTYGDTFRFRVQTSDMPKLYRAEPVHIVESHSSVQPTIIPLTWENLIGKHEQEHQTTTMSPLDRIRQITNQSLTSLDDVGSYLKVILFQLVQRNDNELSSRMIQHGNGMKSFG
jgi:hypothetical protein